MPGDVPGDDWAIAILGNDFSLIGPVLDPDRAIIVYIGLADALICVRSLDYKDCMSTSFPSLEPS